MSKNFIIAGKELDENSNVLEVANSLGMNAFVTTKVQFDSEGKAQPKVTDWNRISPISARSLIVNAENQFGTIDAAVLFFDTTIFSQIFNKNSIEEFNKITDELVLSYAYLTHELLKRFQKKNHGKLFFVLQSMQTPAEFLRKNNHEQMLNSSKTNPIVAMAQASFKTFAENIAAINFKDSESSIYLLEVDKNYTNEQILSWILQKTEQANPVIKNPKQAVMWQTTDEKSKFMSFLK